MLNQVYQYLRSEETVYLIHFSRIISYGIVICLLAPEYQKSKQSAPRD